MIDKKEWKVMKKSCRKKSLLFKCIQQKMPSINCGISITKIDSTCSVLCPLKLTRLIDTCSDTGPDTCPETCVDICRWLNWSLLHKRRSWGISQLHL